MFCRSARNRETQKNCNNNSSSSSSAASSSAAAAAAAPLVDICKRPSRAFCLEVFSYCGLKEGTRSCVYEGPDFAQRRVISRLIGNAHALSSLPFAVYFSNPSVVSFSCPTRRRFFNLPSFPALAFAPPPKLVSFSDTRVVPFPHAVVVEVISDVNRYKEFLPWVEESRIISTPPLRHPVPADAGAIARAAHNGTQLCELRVGFGPFTERYVSRVSISHTPGGPTLVKATASDSSVFSLLVNEWRIQPSTRPGSSLVEFSVSFKFKSPAYAAVAEALFMDLSRRMAFAFEQRFAVLHKAKAKSV